MSQGPYDALPRRPANHAPLSPLGFLPRTASVWRDRTAVIDGARRFTWAETHRRCMRLASALMGLGVGRGDTVATMLPNTTAAFETHFGVPMTGAVLNALNYRLDASAIAFILEHGEADVLITDREFSPIIAEALRLVDRELRVVDVDDGSVDSGERHGELEYEELLERGDPDFAWSPPADEWDAISLNYTSGTTGNPKGVVYHHRGAYLNAVGNAVTWNMGHHPVYLWTLPMFHCNGWCFPWTVTALGGTHVCLRKVEGDVVLGALREHGVTHLCGAPIVMQIILEAARSTGLELEQQVSMLTAAAPPPAAVLEEMARLGIEVTHVYGLTETYGPAVVCAWHDEWNGLPLEEQARLRARQGVPYLPLAGLRVADPESLEAVSRDGETMGEVLFRGNIVMKGYLKNPTATDESFAGGWFHSGDLGVRHPDGYIELRDRSKDIIISGGENISSIEVEGILYRHPAVAAVAVVAKPDPKWGETPCAFVELRAGAAASAEELISYAREHLAHYKCPRFIEFGELPKTSTGKIRKFVLRDRARRG